MNTNMSRSIWLILLLILVSCSSEKAAELSSENKAGANANKESSATVQTGSEAVPYLLQITSTNINRKSAIQFKADGFELSGAGFEWLVNGKPAYGPSSHLHLPESTQKGDLVQARVTVAGKEILSNMVQVGNVPPEISRIKIMPETYKLGDIMYVDVAASDADGDAVTIGYEWSINGEPAGTEKQIGAPIKRWDKIAIKITTFDNESYGKPVVMTREIRNLPPIFVEDKSFIVKGSLYTYQVKAVDSDGDRLVYTLNSAPQGMTIDQGTGMIRWNLPADLKGKTTFSVSVSDGNGGEAKQEFVLDIKPEAGK